jgi:hypothetical protein
LVSLHFLKVINNYLNIKFIFIYFFFKLLCYIISMYINYTDEDLNQ